MSGYPSKNFSIPVVAIPARNEEAFLARPIEALARQTILELLPDPLDVVILLNNTTDRSRAVVEAAAAPFSRLRLHVIDVDLPLARAHVGSARRMAMDRAAALAPSGVILTTDADAAPTDTWIEANLRAIAAGADIVGGRIVGDAEEEAQLGQAFLRRAGLHARYSALRDELAALIDPLEHDPWPRHYDHTGGSLAVRTEVYQTVGGLDPAPFREDIAFVIKVRAAGFRLVHPLDVVVTVSARTQGRAKGGMADCLSTWLREEAEGVPVLVECPIAVERRLRRRKALRETGRMTPSVAREARRALGIPQNNTRSLAALLEHYASDNLDAPLTTPAVSAIAALEDRIVMLRYLPDAALRPQVVSSQLEPPAASIPARAEPAKSGNVSLLRLEL
jgi:GT2 family glycosyltransferase